MVLLTHKNQEFFIFFRKEESFFLERTKQITFIIMVCVAGTSAALIKLHDFREV